MLRWLVAWAVLFACWDARASDDSDWCAPEFETLFGATCHFAPRVDSEHPTLVVFLHGVIKPATRWQYAQQRAIARAAARYGFTVLMPRGRRGVGPSGMEDWWTWPTSVKHQREVEDDILSEWGAARWLLEKRRGTRFSRVLVFGFSNGAYYASQLALRGAYTADGYALFAGGSGAEWLGVRARQVAERPPIFVGFGSKDREARDDGRRLRRLLVRLGWPHRAREQPGGGHTISDALMAEAARYLELSQPRPAGAT